jgi:hypothetical protein
LLAKFISLHIVLCSIRLCGSFALLAGFFLEIFAVENIPFAASGWNMAGQGIDFLPHDLVNVVLALKKIMQHLFGFRERPTFEGKFS